MSGVPSETMTLLRRWREGDPEALGQLVERDLPHIRAHARRRLGPVLHGQEQTGDIVQEAMVRVLVDGPRFVLSDREQFRALVGRIVENVLSTRGRYARRACRDIAREQPATGSVLDLDASATSPSRAAMRSEDQAWLELGLELLPATDRYVIVCRQWEEQSFAEIAATLGASEDATRMRFRRALSRLGRVLADLRSGQLDRALGGCEAGDAKPSSG